MPGLKMTTSIRTSAAGEIEIIDQLLLPHTTSWLPVKTVQDAHSAIKRMQIRGAPAIASLAALTFARELTIALSATEGETTPEWLGSAQALKNYVAPTLEYLNTARPTAVNLGQAMRRLKAVLDAGVEAGKDARTIAEELVKTGHAVADEDVGRNREMAKHGAEWLIERVEKSEGQKRKLRVMTVCNTGSLATSVSAFHPSYTIVEIVDEYGCRDTVQLSV
jgi:methylthioribose-1-phosphate isomerase